MDGYNSDAGNGAFLCASVTISIYRMTQMAASRIENRRVKIGGAGPSAGLQILTRVLERSLDEQLEGVGTAQRNPGEGAPDGADTVILVHGLGVSGAYWLPTARLLSEHYCVLVPDLPGFGDSDKPPRALDMGELARALLSWMDAMGIDRAVLVGNSLGCQVAVRAAMAQPERVSRLILQGMTIDPEARNAATQITRLLADAFLEPPSLLPLVARDYLKCGFRRLIGTLRRILDDPIARNLTRIQVPTLVVRGGRDPIVPQRWAEESARLLPDGRLVVIPGGAHALNFGRPQAFAHVIRDFLESGATGGAGATRGSGATPPIPDSRPDA